MDKSTSKRVNGTFLLVMLGFAAISFLDGCKKDEPVQSVAWYETHTSERSAMVKKCDDDPGELMLTPNCVNASQAAVNIEADKRGWPQPVTGKK